jgi:acyl dehydratase
MSAYFEDLVVGEPIEIGSHTFERAEVLAFARDFDPQPFHLDDAAAAASLFGGLSASGWHTAAIWVRLIVDYRNREADLMRYRGERPAQYGPSPGFENLRWLKPVRVGDTIRYVASVIERRDLASRPDIGLAVFRNEGYNQSGELAISLVSKVFVERRVKLSSANTTPRA